MNSSWPISGHRGLDPGVIAKYTRELARFEGFLLARSKLFPAEISLEDLTEFRAGWEEVYPSSTTRQKVQERLRAFLRYRYEAGWVERVPKLSPIKVDEPPTMPLTDGEYKRLLTTISKEFPDSEKARKVRALVELMRHSGLAIRDAVTLERSEILGRKERPVPHRNQPAEDRDSRFCAHPPEVAAQIRQNLAKAARTSDRQEI